MGKFTTLLAATFALALASPALAGEITGNDKEIDPMGSSICLYSGLNDAPEGDLAGPAGKTQSFGQSVQLGLRDPTALEPGQFAFHPGYLCNPNNLNVKDW